MAKLVKRFFAWWEETWDAIPGYAKVFIYSVTSSVFGLWIAGQLDWKAVIVIVATNLGIYQVPRSVREALK